MPNSSLQGDESPRGKHAIRFALRSEGDPQTSGKLKPEGGGQPALDLVAQKATEQLLVDAGTPRVELYDKSDPEDGGLPSFEFIVQDDDKLIAYRLDGGAYTGDRESVRTEVDPGDVLDLYGLKWPTDSR